MCGCNKASSTPQFRTQQSYSPVQFQPQQSLLYQAPRAPIAIQRPQTQSNFYQPQQPQAQLLGSYRLTR